MAVSDLQKCSGKAFLDSQEKQTLAKMRNEFSKANALKGAATGKQEELDKTLAKKKFYTEKKDLL